MGTSFMIEYVLKNSFKVKVVSVLPVKTQYYIQYTKLLSLNNFCNTLGSIGSAVSVVSLDSIGSADSVALRLHLCLLL